MFCILKLNLILLLTLILIPKGDTFVSIPLIKNFNSFSKLDAKIFDDYQIDPEQYQNNDIVALSPAGLQGFYTLGISAYIKENYNLDDYLFSGASAGAWNALYMTYKGNSWDLPIQLSSIPYQNITSVRCLEDKIKEKLLESFESSDFDFKRLFISVTTIKRYYLQTTIYTDFDNLEDAIDCCIASSHIPFITGGLINRYNNKISFDGGFKKYPYLKIKKPVIHINPDMWKKKNGYIIQRNNNFDFINFFNNLILKDHKNFEELFQFGYNDAKDNKIVLESILNRK